MLCLSKVNFSLLFLFLFESRGAGGATRASNIRIIAQSQEFDVEPSAIKDPAASAVANDSPVARLKP